MLWVILILGFVFGAILQYARLNKYDVISRLSTLEDLTVAKAVVLAIGVGAIIVNIEIALGIAGYHVKPFVFGGIVLGGLIFGAGMAILGYCPGTLAVSLGEGALDALIGIVGGLLGGLVYTLILPGIAGILGPNWGKISLYSITGGANILFFIVLFIIAVAFIYFAFWMDKKENGSDKKWLYAGIALAVLNAFVFLGSVANRPIGASTTYPYLADYLTGLTENAYFQKIQTPGHWEMIFLAGAVLAGLVFSLLKKEFQLRLIFSNWEHYKGTNSLNRIIWAFVGGFILIFGARMAGGCTSGHILSGGMQLAVSSLVFAAFVFIGLLVTGKLFYRAK